MRNLYKALGLGILLFSTINSSGFAQDQMTAREQYEEELNTLKQNLAQQGHHINNLFNDQRFEVYGDIGNRFRNSAERTTPTLNEYKKILDFDTKMNKGVEFLHTHEEQLKKAEQEYGISRHLITAIIGIESQYGQVLGSYNPFNVYVSMIAVDYRADFANAQLKELLAFTQRKNIDVFTLKSSYAGAMSPAQFIPYSVNKWWVGDDIFDMNNSIMSVGNYLAYFKERTNSLRTTILRYNPSDLYADTILDLADAIEEAETNKD